MNSNPTPPHASVRSRIELAAVTLFLMLGSTASAAAGNSAAHVISIAEARALPLGTVVTVDGSVSTPSGAFASSFFDQGFGLQDGSAGIYVSLQTNLEIAPRRQARVTGMLQNSFGLLILVPATTDDIKLHGKGPKLKPRHVDTADVSEATEGLLVRVTGTLTGAPVNDLPFGHKFFLDDGSGEVTIFINVQTGVDVSTLSEGQEITVTGFSSQFEDHYEIDPRGPDDID